jgi:predicted nucleotide-binding protein
MLKAASKSKKASDSPKSSSDEAGKRSYLSQTDVPAYGLQPALRVGQAIADSYGKNPTKPLRVAQAMNMLPGSSTFRMLCGASIAYGLTEGGYNSDLITLTPLGRRIVAPTKEGDDQAAKREALLRPRVVREFLTRYNESKLPSQVIAKNVLEEMAVPPERAGEVFDMLVEGARGVGFLRDVKGQTYVDLDGTTVATAEPDADGAIGLEVAVETSASTPSDDRDEAPSSTVPRTTARKTGRVFITHGRNKEIVGQLKEVLTFGKFTPIVAMEQETVSKPVSDKVMDDMRSCSAAIIHVGTEMRVLDPDGKERRMLNQNVLIEIGAALALYGRNFILLVEKGVELPSNLQGLYEVRYEGEKLDYESTMKLLKAFNDFRS